MTMRGPYNNILHFIAQRCYCYVWTTRSSENCWEFYF